MAKRNKRKKKVKAAPIISQQQPTLKMDREPQTVDIHVLIFAMTIFGSALLIFQIQPILARYILPWFGGSPSVWTTCMLFFQVGLLAGYGYAFLLSRFMSTANQIKIHLVLLVL